MVSVGPAGEVRRLPWPQNHLFFPSSSAVCPRFAAPFLSVGFLVFRSHLSPSCRRLATMLPASFALKPDSSLLLGVEGLFHNIGAIGSTPPPPAEGSSLSRTSVLLRGMGEGMSSKFSVQATVKWYVHLSHFLIIANARGLQGCFEGTPLSWHDHGVLGGNNQKR